MGLIIFCFLKANAKNEFVDTMLLKFQSSLALTTGKVLIEKTKKSVLEIQEVSSDNAKNRLFHVRDLKKSKLNFKFLGFKSINFKPEAILARFYKNSKEDNDLIYTLKYLNSKLDSSYKDSFVFRDEKSFYSERFYLRFHYHRALCFELLDSKGLLLMKAIRKGLNANEARLYIFEKKKCEKILPFVTTLIIMQFSGTPLIKIRYNKVKF